MQKKNNHSEEDKLRKKIEEVLKEDASSIKPELPDESWSPLLEPIKDYLYDITEKDRDILFRKILSWIFNVYDLPYNDLNKEADTGCSYFTSIKPIEDCKDEDFLSGEAKNLDVDPIQLDTIYDIEAISMSRLRPFNLALQSIIRCVHTNPKTFISLYATRKQLYCGNKDEELLCIDNLITDLKKFVDSSELLLIPTPNLYITKTDDKFLVQDGGDTMAVYEMSEEEKASTFYYNTSKQTSDNFTKVFIKLFEYRRKALLSQSNFSSNEPNSKANQEPDTRIDCKANDEQISAYFMKLAQKDKTGQQIMKKEDVEYLLCANFKGFQPEVNSRKMTPHINQANLRYFVYQFYFQYSKTTHEADVYARFLKDNFTRFENTEIDVIKKSFSRKPARYPSHLM